MICIFTFYFEYSQLLLKITMGTNILSSYYMTGNMRKFENIENELINNYNIKREEIKLGFFEGNFFVEIKSGQQLIYKHLFNLF